MPFFGEAHPLLNMIMHKKHFAKPYNHPNPHPKKKDKTTVTPEKGYMHNTTIYFDHSLTAISIPGISNLSPSHRLPYSFCKWQNITAD